MSEPRPEQAEAARRYVREVGPPGGAPIDWAAMPPLVKTYPGAPRTSLHYPIHLPGPGGLSLAAVGDLVGSAVGLSRLDWWGSDQAFTAGAPGSWPGVRPVVSPARPVASGGRLYPSEVYLANRPIAGLEAGLYHYTAGLHALERLRDEDVRGLLMACLAEPPASAADLVVVVATLFWRNAFKYREFAYRLQALDAGVVAGQLLVLAGACGLAAAVHLDFADTEVDRVLGLDPARESACLVVTMRSPGEQAVPPPPGPRAAGAPSPRAALEGPSREAFPLAAALHAASLHESPLRRSAQAASASPAAGRPAGPRTGLPGLRVELETGVARRRSALDGFRIASLEAGQLGSVLEAASAGYASDTGGTGHHVAHTELYCAVSRVAGVQPGLYRYDARARELELVRAGGVYRMLAPSIRFGHCGLFEASAAIFPVGSYERGFPWFGDRWYRMQNIECGLVAQRISLAAAALGLGAHIRCDYDIAGLDRLLGLGGGPRTTLVMVLVGHPREPAGPTLQLRRDLPRGPQTAAGGST